MKNFPEIIQQMEKVKSEVTNEWLKTEEAAAHLKVSVGTLRIRT